MNGKVAVIAGFETELGTAIAAHFAAQGASLVCVTRSTEQPDALRSIQESGSDIRVVAGDVLERSVAEAVAATCREAFGRADVLVNYSPVRRLIGTIHELTDEEIDEEIDADVKRVIALSRTVVPVIAESGGGAVVNISSIASDGVKGRVLRSAGKAALNSLTVAMALDHGPQNIRANALLLGPVASSRRSGSGPRSQSVEDVSPLKRVTTPQEVAATVAFLTSDAAASITGVQLRMDGGRSLRIVSEF